MRSSGLSGRLLRRVLWANFFEGGSAYQRMILQLREREIDRKTTHTYVVDRNGYNNDQSGGHSFVGIFWE
jgi:hypothetical protein